MDEAPRTLDELLREAEARIERLLPDAALAAAEAGALLVDIRSEAARERDGVVPDAIHIPRTVLEWRFEPAGRWQNPARRGPRAAGDRPLRPRLPSPLAAAMLARLGYARAGDVIGGFDAWREAGLPTRPASREAPEGLPGMAGPD